MPKTFGRQDGHFLIVSGLFGSALGLVFWGWGFTIAGAVIALIGLALVIASPK